MTGRSTHGGGERVNTYRPVGSAAPGNLDALSLCAGEAVGTLLVHEDAWRRALGWTTTPWRGSQDQQLAGVLHSLTTNLPWAGERYDSVDDLADDLRRLVPRMRAVAKDDPRRSKNLNTRCPLPVLHDYEEEPCGGGLVFTPGRLPAAA